MASGSTGDAMDGALEAKVVAYKGQRMAVIRLYGAIGPPNGFQASQFVDSLSRLGDYDVLYAILDSSGGSAIDAWIIHDFLNKNRTPRQGSLVLVTNECSGSAILIALAFKQILMRSGSYIRFQPIELSRPIATRRASQVLARLTSQRIKCRVEDVLGWMDKNKKFSAEECLKLSLCDAIV